MLEVYPGLFSLMVCFCFVDCNLDFVYNFVSLWIGFGL